MKKTDLIIFAMFFSLLSMGLNAQSAPEKDYFAGKWNVFVAGTPNGDANMLLNLNREEGKLAGTITFEGAEELPLSSVTEQENAITVYFYTMGYDVYITLGKKDEDHVTGSLMDMFDATGERVKETDE